MNIKFVDLKAQYLSIKNEIDNAIKNVINETAFIKGKHVEKFENEYKQKYNIRNVIGCGNGTDAIYISLKALGIGEGDEVITTANSWISTSQTITQTGAKPVFVDIEPYFYSIDTEKIEEKITAKTKAIIPVHLYGHPANMTNIMDIAKRHSLFVIEDCAQAHFAKWKNKNVGTFGDFATFSFFPGKNLGAYGDAGCIITDNDDLAIKARMYANHGALVKHKHEIEGINSRLDGIQAAILSVKLKYIDEWTKLRIKCAENYTLRLSENSDIILPEIHSDARHVFHLFVIRTSKRSGLIEYLNKNSIATGIHYPTALPFLKAYSYLNAKSNDYSIAYDFQNKILSLPIFPELKSIQIDYICDKINFFNKV